MGAELAVIASSPPGAESHLGGFNDVVVLEVHLPPEDQAKWVVMGRVAIWNKDEDAQDATAKLIRGKDDVLDEVLVRIGGDDQLGACFYVQAGFRPGGQETVSLACNSYTAQAYSASLIVFKVDDIDVQ
jgi:hypothetical protein